MNSLKFINENCTIIKELVNECRNTGDTCSKLLPNKTFIQVSKECLNDFFGSRECIKIMCVQNNKQVACLYEEV